MKYNDIVENGGKTKYYLVKDIIAIKLKKAILFSQAKKILKITGDLICDFDLKKEDLNCNLFWLKNSHSIDELFPSIQEILKNDLEYIAPVYTGFPDKLDNQNFFCITPNRIYLKEDLKFSNKIKELAKKHKINSNKYIDDIIKVVNTKYAEIGNYLFFNSKDNFSLFIFLNELTLSGYKSEIIYNSIHFYRTEPLSSDPLFTYQWNLNKIRIEDAWLSTNGNPNIIVSVIDTGCNINHEDLVDNIFVDFNGKKGYYLPDIGTANTLNDIREANVGTLTHGTNVAGIIVAKKDNIKGIAGIANNCKVLNFAYDSFLGRIENIDVINALMLSLVNGVKVINISLGMFTQNHYPFARKIDWVDDRLDIGISNMNCLFKILYENNVLVCASVGNINAENGIGYPASNKYVMAIGASDQNDLRSRWGNNGSNYGYILNQASETDIGDSLFLNSTTNPLTIELNGDPINYNGENYEVKGISVVAPSVVPTTTYDNPLSPNSQYTYDFDGTSASAPHVTGLAALLFSKYPTISAKTVKDIIEKTADRVGGYNYQDILGFKNGKRCTELGYGRINAYKALNYAEIVIKDNQTDIGNIPSLDSEGNFWDFSDIVVRTQDDGIFEPSNISKSKYLERGQENYIYIKVSNLGPATNDIKIRCKVVAKDSSIFSKEDFMIIDSFHLPPIAVLHSFVNVQSNSFVIAKFKLNVSQIETLFNWEYTLNKQIYILARCFSSFDNDINFASTEQMEDFIQFKNNVACRKVNITDER